MPSSDTRETWIDALKGIGIILVIIGHVEHGLIRDVIFLFHMPLFFLVSGYLYSERALGTHLKRKAVQLLLPYCSFLLILLIPPLAKIILTGNQQQLLPFLSNAALGGEWLTGWYSAFWFITCLFFTQQVYNLIHIYTNKITINLVMLLFASLAYINMHYFSKWMFPFAVNIVLMALPLFHIGMIASNWKSHILSVKSAVLAIVWTVLILSTYGVFTVDYKAAIYGPLITGLATSIAMTVISAFLADSTTRVKYLNYFLSYCGTASLTIMFLHQPIQISLKAYAGLTSSLLIITLTLILCLAMHHLISQFSTTRLIFFGSNKELR